jgi:hypothetical protein
MDLNDFRAGVTVVSLLAFLFLVWRVYSRRAADYRDCAELPFQDEPSAVQPPHTSAASALAPAKESRE